MLEELKSKSNQQKSELYALQKNIEYICFDLTEAIADKFEPDFFYKKNQNSIELVFKNSDSVNSIHYIFSYVSKEIRVEQKIMYSFSSKEFKDNIEESEKLNQYISDINKYIKNIDEKLVASLFVKLKNNQKSLNKLQIEFDSLENEITVLEKKSDFKVLDKVLENVDFCIDTFLCNKFSVKYKDKPNRADLKKLKEIIKQRKIETTFDFLCKIQNLNLIQFQAKTLIIKPNGTYYVSGLKRSKNAINECLSQQFMYNGRLATLENFNRSDLFYMLFPKYLSNTQYQHYHFYSGYGLIINIEDLKQKLGKEALRKDLLIF